MIIHAVSQDGLWSVIEAVDFPPGIGRSRSRKTPGEALKAQWEPTLTTPVGPGSLHDFVLVRSMDIAMLQAQRTRIMVKARDFGGGKVIPDYPHKCHVCGGRTLELFSSVEHEGGACPGRKMKVR